MSISKLWQKLFSRTDEATEIALHISGATVRPRNPFEGLEAYRNTEELSEDFINKWVMDFYMTSLNARDSKVLEAFAKASKEITPQIVKQLLGDFDWRPRIVGAYFAAIKEYSEMKDIIGVHLLKSEVCYAGAGYALALAVFGDEQSKGYLEVYLDFYLKQKDLWFDQADVLAALYIISSGEAETYLASWQDYIADKPYHSLDGSIENIQHSLEITKQLREFSS